MSILDGLSDPGAVAVGLGQYVSKDAVREALTNPTDEQVTAIAERARRTLGAWVTGYEVRAVLAAAAGGVE